MLRIAFMGTPSFAIPTLAKVIAAGHDVAAVYTQPPRSAGRGLEQTKSPIHDFAELNGLTVLTPTSLKDATVQLLFTAHRADVAVVVAYGLILPSAILEMPRGGCLNLHASALPRWRGAAPIQRAIMAGDTRTAASIMRMDEGLDTGPICRTEEISIGPDMTAGELHDLLSQGGAELMVEALAELEREKLACRSQAVEGVTYAAKIENRETRIDFTLAAEEVHNRVRGLSPSPGAWLEVNLNNSRERIKLLRTRRAEGGGIPGTVLDERLTVACGSGSVRFLELQRAGKRAMGAEEFLRGFPLAAGTRLQSVLG